MKYIKLSILTRSLDALYDYNKAGRSFWDDLAHLLNDKSIDAAMEKRGSLQRFYYFPLEEDVDPVPQITQMIRQLGPDPGGFVISAVEMSASDVEQLKKNDTDHINAKTWFRAAEAQLSSHTNKDRLSPVTPSMEEQPEPSPEKPNSAVAQEETPSTENDTKNAGASSSQGEKEAVCRIPDVGSDLANEAKRIHELKSALLQTVRGQRHAVDEVVQTIFECDAFNRLNDDRKGPLATFLFTGPSGVGKTFLAEQCAILLGRKKKVIDMSEYSDNLSNGKFNGEHGQHAVVTSFVRKYPDGILIFDEIEKAHINTIHLFLQILDAGRLMDIPTNKEVSFRDTIVFITSNAGASLYEDPTVVDLSGVSRRVILEALRSDIKPGTNNEPFFPACITTRFANGHVLLFNHLEPFALMQIVQDELQKQIQLFRKSYGVEVTYDPTALAALVLYSTGGIADARSLRGTAKNIIVKELQDIILQTYQTSGESVNALKQIEITVDPTHSDQAVQDLFIGHEATHVPVFADTYVLDRIRPMLAESSTEYEYFSDPDAMKRRARGVVDYILLDPLAGERTIHRRPNDLEDVDADGTDLFRYLKEFFPEIPIYFLDVRAYGESAFSSLLATGGRGVIALDPEDPNASEEQLRALSFSALVNNSTFELGRSRKILTYNCSQYTTDATHATIAFDKLSLGYAPSSSDDNVIVRADDKNGVTFEDVIGCKTAKKALESFCRFVADPRKAIMQGKKNPKGVLLYGPPGTGKTMLAKAMANEAKAAFIPTTATALLAPHFGESENKVRELFRRARRYAPAVIFIDEVDAIARARTGSETTVHYENVLNALIAEMDGFSTDERRPVFILAATNYDISGEGSRVLDPAFVRRFDRKIFIDLPDTDDRFELLQKVLSRHGVNLGKDHEKVLKNLAERSSGLSNADLTTIIDMFLRTCEDKDPSASELMDALDAFRFGEINDMDSASLRQTACHESGHALVYRLLGNSPAYLTIVGRGNFGGYMEHDHTEQKTTSTFGDLMNQVCTALAGRAAEIEMFGTEVGLNTGASSDLARARFLIRTALNDFAMGEKIYIAGTDEDCEKLMQEQLSRTVALLHDHRAVLDQLTELLLSKKNLNKAELEAFFSEHML